MEVKDGRETMFGIRIALSDVSMTIIFMVLSLDYDFLFVVFIYILYYIVANIGIPFSKEEQLQQKDEKIVALSKVQHFVIVRLV